jgi:putative tricarboxylic transport membrane protein
MKISDRLTGLLLALLGLATIWGGSRFPPVPGQQVGPAVFPVVVGVGLAALGVLIALHVGRSFEDEAEADAAAHAATDALEDAAYARRRRWLVLLPPALLVFYYGAADRIGFLPTAALMIAALATAFGAKRLHILPLAIFGALFIQTVFVKLLRVPLAPMPFW